MSTPLTFWQAALLGHLWQSTLFGLGVAVFILCIHGVPSRLRHLAGLLALLRFVLPLQLLLPPGVLVHLEPSRLAWLPSGLGVLWMPAFIVHGGAGAAVAEAPTGVSIFPLLLGFWALGALLFLGLGLRRLALGLLALRRCATPLTGVHRDCLEHMLARAGLPAGSVAGFTVPSSHWLGVVGLFRSRVIIPEGLLSELDDREVSSLLLHELMHVRRRDNLLRLLQSVVVALFWFHPLVWWLDRRLRWESEAACDEGVLRLTGANAVYASSLFKATRFALGLNLPGVSGMSRLGLQSRIRAVLKHQNDKESPVKLTLIAATLIGAFGLTTLLASAPETPPASIPATLTTPASVKVFDMAELDKVPALLKSAQPQYPHELRNAKIRGEVVAAFVVDEQGAVTGVKIVRSSDKRFEQPVMDAVSQWHFSAGLKNGQAVRVAMQVPIVFSLTP